MNVIDLATKTMQTAIKGVVDAIKTTTDSTKTTVDATKVVVDTTKTNIDVLLAGRVVKSVQRGSVVGITGTPTQTITISPVNTSKSLVFSSYKTPSGLNGAFDVVSELKSASSIEISSGSSDTKHYIAWQVIEFY